MRSVAEVYTYPPNARTDAAREARDRCLCRFRGPGLECEQQNNRGQVALVQLRQYPDLRRQYGRDTIPLGVCSIVDGDRPWIVCPIRLFYTGPIRPTLEHSIYQAWGFQPGDKLALWREVRALARRRSKTFRYNFDYVFRKVVDEERPLFQNVPFVVEVMACSTSGGGITNAFADALRGRSDVRVPSINKRQVLGRMMSQLVAKAEVVHAWGGKTAWVVQDVFWEYVNETTGFNMDEFRDDPEGNMVVVVRKLETAGYDPRRDDSDSFNLRLERILRGWDRFERSQGRSSVGRDFVSLLNAPFVPDVEAILRPTDRRPPDAVVECEQ